MANYVPLSGDESLEEFSVKVLFKEKTYVAGPFIANSTVSDLKNQLITLCEVPTQQQRLIFSGRSLVPDSNTLLSFNVKNNSFIHLFPLPVPTATATPAVSTTTGNIHVINPMTLQFNLNPTPAEAFPHRLGNLQNDPVVGETSEPVKMWQFILFFSSMMTLFTFFMNLVTLGVAGNNIFDTCVNTVEALLSMAGVYVSRLGMDVIEAIDFDRLNRFVRLLIAVGIGCIILRCFWVADVILEAQALNDSDAKTSDKASIDMGAFTTQALIIASIFIFSWISCMYRAVRFRNVVSTFDTRRQVAPVEVPATVLTVV